MSRQEENRTSREMGNNDMQKPIKDFLAFFLFFSRKKRNKTRKNNNKFKEMRKK
jgi:hypothetical protein